MNQCMDLLTSAEHSGEHGPRAARFRRERRPLLDRDDLHGSTSAGRVHATSSTLIRDCGPRMPGYLSVPLSRLGDSSPP